MTFWEYVKHDASRDLPPAHELGRSLRELHAALADFPGELGQLSDIRDWLDGLLAELRPSPRLTLRDRDLVRSRLYELTPTVFESSLPAQAIHGDASASIHPSSRPARLRLGGRLVDHPAEACAPTMGKGPEVGQSGAQFGLGRAG
jgi:hypothetical protein